MTGIFPFVFLVVLSVTLFAYATTILLSEKSAQKQFWNSQLWSGPRRTIVLAGLSGKIDSLFNTRSLVHNGYNKFSKHNLPFAIPQFNSDPVLILPASHVQALVRKSDDEVDLPLVAEFSTAARYTGDQYIVRNPRHVDLVKQQLTRKLPSLTASIAEELALGFNDKWKGEATRWSTVPLFPTCTKIVSRGANRVFCGTELCRNPEFLDRSRRYTQAVFGAAAVINLFPAWGKLLVSQIVTLPMWMHLKACNRIAAPVIKQRLQAISGKVGETQSKPNDAMQWLIEDCFQRGDSFELDPTILCRRLLRLNMAAIHTTSISITNVLLDLCTLPDASSVVEGLREECKRVLSAHEGVWSKAAIGELHRVDSTIKESMRLRSFGLIGTNRVVTHENGIRFGDGTPIPAGVRIATPIDAIHRDSQFYRAPDDFHAFRFSEQIETKVTPVLTKKHHNTSGDSAAGGILANREHALVTTSDTFLVFGHGRHACPGRFFASQEMKLMLAHVVMHYDLRMEGPRPKNTDLGIASLPSQKVKIQIRKRV